MKCQCGYHTGRCVECGQVYTLGEYSHCTRKRCIEVNAPIECAHCGCVVSQNLDGVLNCDMDLIPWAEED